MISSGTVVFDERRIMPQAPERRKSVAGRRQELRKMI
jgi:hypothetical protein